jgi:hypothetical protein
MSFRKRASGGKRDTAEAAILDALHRVGAETWQLAGRGNPDVLVRFRGIYTPLEVKTGKGRRTENQTAIPWPLVRTPEQALQAIGAIR